MLSAFLSKKFNFLVCFITICNSKYLMCYDLFMKTLKDFENELSKCSKCGLCSQACPIYKLTLNDCTVSKGKFLMLLGVAKGDLKLSKNINKYLDMCLKCKKCNEFCPAGIDVCTILNYAKYEYMSKTIVSKFINFLQSRLIFSNIIKLFQFISKPFRPQKRPHYENAKNIIYFKGCVNQICPKADNYINKIFKDIPINIIEPDFDCCGLPFLSEGNMKRFIKSAKHNIKNFGTEYDFIVNDCASCEDTILNYPKYIDDFEINRGKVINWGNLIALNEIKFKFNNPVKVTFHKPCHIKNDAFFNQILTNTEKLYKCRIYSNGELRRLLRVIGDFRDKKPEIIIRINEFKSKKYYRNRRAVRSDYLSFLYYRSKNCLKKYRYKSRKLAGIFIISR